MSKHTPGPWVVEKYETADCKTTLWVRAPNGFSISCIGHKGYEANARLIAAAPEMHDFLRDILEARGIDEHGLATLKDFFDNLKGNKNGTP